MTANVTTEERDENGVKKAFSCTPFSIAPGPALEKQIVLVNLNTVKAIEKKLSAELQPLKERQDLVTLHHKVLKETNLLIDANNQQLDAKKFQDMIAGIKGDLDVKMANERESLIEQLEKNPKAQDKIDRLQEKYKPLYDFLDGTVTQADTIRNGADVLTKEQRDRMVDNIRMDMDDLNVQNDMQLQKVSRLKNEHSESYQNARMMLRTIRDMIKNIFERR